ncbi:hypothetical protein GCM10022403_002270 [Streptomyces coacervatus]|uniref:Uncharacterized protein n=1 Tax=Streptomyces coacervatus TaxID=647381 RepID=A0ABP7GPU8_9ACTN
MHFSLGSRPGRTLLHQSCYPESRPAVPVRADVSASTRNAGHGVVDSAALYGAVVPADAWVVVSEAEGG